MRTRDIRQKFIEFFESKGHLHLPSAPLIPQGDQTLLFINAGMAQFKEYFLGKEKPPHPRITTYQKCIRTVDIDKVGTTPRHLTFFEMLGNFSFGDYFKEKAITLAWEFVTEVLGIPEEELAVTVYEKDEEAFRIWTELINVPPERIGKFGEEDNFWKMGKVGPAGPCTEIHYDFRTDEECVPGGCDRYLEIWNLVFMQYNLKENGSLEPLPQKNIDTGMGLERVAAVLQGKSSVFATDVFKPIVEEIKRRAKANLTKEEETRAVRVVADHARASTFMVADGVYPSNVKRGYVLRRVIRRGCVFLKKLGITPPFLHELSPLVAETLGEAYPEIKENLDMVREVVREEEEHFLSTMERGENLLEEKIEAALKKGEKELSGKTVFVLYDTYGFPKELTEEILKERGLTYNKEEFEKELQKQRERARKDVEKKKKLALNISSLHLPATRFVGYDRLKIAAKLLWHHIEEKVGRTYLVFETTPFYPESGGQLGDVGWIYLEKNGERRRVLNTIKEQGVIIHVCEGLFSVDNGKEYVLEVDREIRMSRQRAHTATHLLHSALRKVLGEGATQAGSLVSSDYLRFDFYWPRKLSEKELRRVEELVNRWVLEDYVVRTFTTDYKRALEMGAMALFGEKYGEEVRVVEISPVSVELCGGTHLERTSEVGSFKITTESSIGSGIRRIEGVVGWKAYELFFERSETLSKLKTVLKTKEEDLVKRAEELYVENTELKKKIARIMKKLLLNELSSQSGKVLKATTKLGVKESRNALAPLLSSEKRKVIIVECEENSKRIVIIADSEEKAGEIVAHLKETLGGKGGGKGKFAQYLPSVPLSKVAEEVEKLI